jgi:hypothetical protein
MVRQTTIAAANDRRRFVFPQFGERYIRQHERKNAQARAHRHERDLVTALFTMSKYGTNARTMRAEAILTAAYNLALSERQAADFPTDGEAKARYDAN